MNLLLIDIGNTHVVCAILQDDTIVERLRIPSDLNFFNQLIPLKTHAFDGVVLSSVVPVLTEVYVEACRNLFHQDPLVLFV